MSIVESSIDDIATRTMNGRLAPEPPPPPPPASPAPIQFHPPSAPQPFNFGNETPARYDFVAPSGNPPFQPNFTNEGALPPRTPFLQQQLQPRLPSAGQTLPNQFPPAQFTPLVPPPFDRQQWADSQQQQAQTIALQAFAAGRNFERGNQQELPGEIPQVYTPPPTQNFLGAPVSNMPGYYPPAPPLPQSESARLFPPEPSSPYYGATPNQYPNAGFGNVASALNDVYQGFGQGIQAAGEAVRPYGAMYGRTVARGGLLGTAARRLGVPNTIATGGLGALPGSQATHEQIGGAIGGFGASQVPFLALYAAAPEVGIPTAALDAYFGSQAAISGKQTIDAYQNGQIDAKTALLQLAPDIVMAAPAVFHGLKLAPELKAAVEGAPQVQRMGGLAGERGSLEPPVGPEGPKAVPPAAAEGANLPVPPGTQALESHMGAQFDEFGRPVPAQQVPGKLNPEQSPIDMASLQVSDWLRRGEKVRPEQETMFAQQRAQQTAKMSEVFARGGTAEEAKAVGAGRFETPKLAPLQLSPEAEQAIRQEIRQSGAFDIPQQKIRAEAALDAMQAGHLPQPDEAIQIGKVLGVQVFLDMQKVAPTNWSNEVLGVIGLPQGLQSGMDASAILRQMAPLGWSNPKEYFDAIGTIARSAASEEGAHAVQQETDALATAASEIGQGADAVTYNALAGRQADIGGHLHESEGQFSALNRSKATQALEKYVPWQKLSERIYNVPINRLRVSTYNKIAEQMWANGVRDLKRYKDLVNVVEHASGWGTYEPNRISAFLNALYSPRNFVARFQLLADPFTKSGSLFEPSARQLAAKSLVGFAGVNAAMLGLVAGSGALAGSALGIPNPVHVELDPRSTDFAKAKIGNLRVDMTGGFGSLARLMARLSPMALGHEPQVKDINGIVRGAKASDLVDTFLRGKLGPVPAVIWDMAGFPGSQGFGADVKSKEGLRTLAFNSLTPFFVQDVVNAYRETGKTGAGIAAPVSFLGGGVNAYAPSQGDQTRGLFGQVKQAGFQPLFDRRQTADQHRADYIKKYGGTRAQDQAAASHYDASPAVKKYLNQLNADELKFWTAHKALLKQVYDYNQSQSTSTAKVDTELSDTQIKKLLGIR